MIYEGRADDSIRRHEMIFRLFTTLLVVMSLLAGLSNAQTVQAGFDVSGTSLVISAKPTGTLSGNFSAGNVTIVWPTSLLATLGAVTNNIGIWSVQGSGTSGANSYVTYGFIAPPAPTITWANGSVNELFRVVVNQTGTGTGTFTLSDGVPPDGTGIWYFEVSGVDRTNYGTPFFYSRTTEVEVGLAAKVLSLSNNYPNPFNPSTNIEFTLPSDGRVVLKVYNILGQEVAELFDGEAQAGRILQVRFDATEMSTGLYFYQLQFGGKTLMKRMLLVK